MKQDGRKNNGGRREGAGHPFNATTKAISLRMDIDLLESLPKNINRNGYINDAVRKQMIADGYTISDIRSSLNKKSYEDR